MQHFDGDKAHGPVQVFLSDSGRIAFVCAVDQATWEMAIPLVKAKAVSYTHLTLPTNREV